MGFWNPKTSHIVTNENKIEHVLEAQNRELVGVERVGVGWVLGHVGATNFYPTFVTHGNTVKIGGTKLGNVGSVWVGFGTRKHRILGFRPNID